MTKFLSLALLAMTLSGATMAHADNKADPNWTDQSKPCGGYSCDSQQGTRAFWDYETENGGK